MPSPTIANQIKLTLFKLGKINKNQLTTTRFEHYSDPAEENFDEVKFETLDLGSNSITIMLNEESNFLIEGLSIWTEDYFINREPIGELYDCYINNKKYILTIDE
jgi:hypothetical protein